MATIEFEQFGALDDTSFPGDAEGMHNFVANISFGGTNYHYILTSTIDGDYIVKRTEVSTPYSWSTVLTISLKRRFVSSVGSSTNWDTGRGVLRFFNDALHVFVTGENTGTSHHQLYYNYTNTSGVWQTASTTETPTEPYMAVDMQNDGGTIYLMALVDENDLTIYNTSWAVQKTYTTGTNKLYVVGDVQRGNHAGDWGVAVSTPTDYGDEDYLKFVTWDYSTGDFDERCTLDISDDAGIPEFDNQNLLIQLEEYWMLCDKDRMRILTSDISTSGTDVLITVKSVSGSAMYYLFDYTYQDVSFIMHRDTSTNVTIYACFTNRNKIYRYQKITIGSSDSLSSGDERYFGLDATSSAVYSLVTSSGYSGTQIELVDMKIYNKYIRSPWATAKYLNDEMVFEKGDYVIIKSGLVSAGGFRGIVSDFDSDSPRRIRFDSFIKEDLEIKINESYDTKTIPYMITDVLGKYGKALKAFDISSTPITTYSFNFKNYTLGRFLLWCDERESYVTFIDYDGNVTWHDGTEPHYQDYDFKKADFIEGKDWVASGNPSDWTLTESNPDTVIEIIAYEDYHDLPLKIYDNSASLQAIALKTFSAQTTGTVEFHCKVSAISGNYIYIDLLDASNNVGARIRIDSSQNIYYFGQSAYEDSGVDADVWNHISISFNSTTDTWDITINNNLIDSGCSYFDGAVGDITQFKIYTDTTSTSTSYFDAFGWSWEGYNPGTNFTDSTYGHQSFVGAITKKRLPQTGRVILYGGYVDGERLKSVSTDPTYYIDNKTTRIGYFSFVVSQSDLDDLADKILLSQDEAFIQIEFSILRNDYFLAGRTIYIVWNPPDERDDRKITLQSFIILACEYLPNQEICNVTATNSMFYPEENLEYIQQDNMEAISQTQVLVQENTTSLAVKLNAKLVAPTTDTWDGITQDFVCGETLAFGDLCCRKDSDSEMYKTDIDDATEMPAVAICVEAGGDGDTREFLTYGVIHKATWSFSDIGQPIYASTTDGGLTQTRPTTPDEYAQQVAIAISADQILFNPQEAEKIEYGWIYGINPYRFYKNLANSQDVTPLMNASGEWVHFTFEVPQDCDVTKVIDCYPWCLFQSAGSITITVLLNAGSDDQPSYTVTGTASFTAGGTQNDFYREHIQIDADEVSVEHLVNIKLTSGGVHQMQFRNMTVRYTKL